jgi:hypothetical protein
MMLKSFKKSEEEMFEHYRSLDSFRIIFPKFLENPILQSADLSTSHIAILDCTESLINDIIMNQLVIPEVGIENFERAK